MSLLRLSVMMVCWVVLAVPSVRAERFTGIAEAQRLMFPGAASFQAVPIRYSAAEVRAIEKRSGTKVLRGWNYAWIARDGTNFLGVVIHDQVLGKHELIDYAVAIDAAGRVQSVEILEYRESYGGEIRGTKWRAQFRGKGADDPIRLNRDIHNLSGATMSCRHVTEGVKRLVASFDVVRARLLDGDGMSQPVAAARR